MDCYAAGMAIRPAPTKLSPVMRSLQAEAKRQEVTAYAIAKHTGIAVNTIRRMLMGEGSPTLATVESVATALGMVVKVEGKRVVGVEKKPGVK